MALNKWLNLEAARQVLATATGCLCGREHEPYFHVTEGAAK